MHKYTFKANVSMDRLSPNQLLCQASQICPKLTADALVIRSQTGPFAMNVYKHTTIAYVEIFAGILFREVVKKLAPQNLWFYFHKYAACLVLRPVTDKFRGFYFRECRLTHKI